MKENREDLEARIAAYIDGQLPAADAARLEVFLANTDPALAQQVIGMIAERHAVRALPKPEAPDDLAARIMEQVERASLLSDVEHFAAPRRPWWQSRAAVAASLILVLGGFTWFILQAVRRPNSSWRETAVDDTSHREIAAAPAAPSIAPSTPAAATVPAGIALDTADAPSMNASTSAGTLSSAMPAPSAAETATQIAAASSGTSVPQSNTANSPTNEQPVLLAFVARDSQDYGRLRSRLEELLAGDPEAGRNQVALNKDVAANLQPRDAVRDQISPNSTDKQNQFTQGQTLQGNSSASNADEQFAARAAAKSTPRQEETTGSYQFYNPQQRAFNSSNMSSNGNMLAGSSGGGSPPLPYRVSLRPDQIQQLTHDFQMESATRDRRAITGYAAPAQNLQNLQNLSTNNYKTAAHTTSDSAKEKSADTWIDCIITMDPPASAPSTALPLTSPAPSTQASPLPPESPASQPR